MRHFLFFVLLLSTFHVLGQTQRKTITAKGKSNIARKPVATVLPTAALVEMGKRLTYYCSDEGDDFIRAFVYRAYMNQGVSQRYQVDEHLSKLATNKKSRGILLQALYERLGGNESYIIDNLYSSLHMSLTNSKTLGHFIVKSYAEVADKRRKAEEADQLKIANETEASERLYYAEQKENRRIADGVVQ